MNRDDVCLLKGGTILCLQADCDGCPYSALMADESEGGVEEDATEEGPVEESDFREYR